MMRRGSALDREILASRADRTAPVSQVKLSVTVVSVPCRQPLLPAHNEASSFHTLAADRAQVTRHCNSCVKRLARADYRGETRLGTRLGRVNCRWPAAGHSVEKHEHARAKLI
ncbi:hypothetical protein J6590_046070 [Homalodisca vitripennis]|nr:hypothetical protein J6590_046070 [Homalodisca vitripennis]